MDDHSAHDATCDTAEVERAPETPRTGNLRSALRSAASRRAGEIVAGALSGRASASSPQIAARLGITGTPALKLLRGEMPWHVGDLMLLAHGDFEAVIVALRAARSPETVQMNIERRLRRITQRTGEFAKCVDVAMLDGRIDDDEHREINQHVIGIAIEATAAVGGGR